MNKKLINYINKHGDEKISNFHLMFINGLINESFIGEYGILYKLSNYVYNNIKNKTNKTLNEIIISFNNKKQ